MSGCRIEVPIAVSHRAAGHGRKFAIQNLIRRARPPSVQACSRQSAAITVLLPIRFRSGLACRLPGSFEFLWYAVAGLEVHLIRRLPT